MYNELFLYKELLLNTTMRCFILKQKKLFLYKELLLNTTEKGQV